MLAFGNYKTGKCAIYSGAKGLLYMELRAHEPKRIIHSASAEPGKAIFLIDDFLVEPSGHPFHLTHEYRRNPSVQR
jgi:hypothetical protein